MRTSNLDFLFFSLYSAGSVLLLRPTAFLQNSREQRLSGKCEGYYYYCVRNAPKLLSVSQRRIQSAFLASFLPSTSRRCQNADCASLPGKVTTTTAPQKATTTFLSPRPSPTAQHGSWSDCGLGRGGMGHADRPLPFPHMERGKEGRLCFFFSVSKSILRTITIRSGISGTANRRAEKSRAE